MQRFAELVLTMAAFVSIAGFAEAQSLAGKEGDVRRKPYFPALMTGGCDGAYQQYIAARGHAAYASTPDGPEIEGIVCASAGGASQKAAEATALKSCEAGRKKYKVDTVGRCIIFASK
jgi:hypothetical protein